MRRWEMFHKQQIVFYCILLLSTATPAFAADPPGLDSYKAKVEAAIADSCAAVARKYPNDQGPPDNSINLSAVYYDSTKVMYELMNLYESASIGAYDVSTCIEQSATIINNRYIDSPQFSGFERFPHGVFRHYVTTGSATDLTSVDNFLNKTNWRSVNVNANQQVRYSREVAYALQTYVQAHVFGQPHEDNETLVAHFLEMSLGHLIQWHDANPYGTEISETNKRRSSFMVGLAMMSLIEYYEWYDPDPRIPPAVKNIIDDLWDEMWWPNIHDPEPSTLGDTCNYAQLFQGVTSGAFWYLAMLNDQGAYEIIPNALGSSCDVAADLSMLIGPAYQWYALHSGDDSYQEKALDIFDGMIDMAWFGNDGRHHWEATRYTDDFIRWYRKNTGSVCGPGNLNICESSPTCAAAGGNWNGVTCQYLPVTNPVVGYTKPGETPGHVTCYLDADGDGYSNGTSETAESCSTDYYLATRLTSTTGDCNDSNPGINPGVTEIPGNNIDDDCDDSIDNVPPQQPHRLRIVDGS